MGVGLVLGLVRSAGGRFEVLAGGVVGVVGVSWVSADQVSALRA